jgi:hypothetical protein
MIRTSLLYLFFTVIINVECRTISWGNLQPRNVVLFDQFFNENQETNVDFQNKYGLKITAIHITDLTNNEDGGKVKITSGGIGYNYVKLKMIQENNKQILLNVEIFGSYRR